MRVLSSLNAKPLGASHAASRALTCSACCREWQQTTMSSAYLTRIGFPQSLHRHGAGGDVADSRGLLQPM